MVDIKINCFTVADGAKKTNGVPFEEGIKYTRTFHGSMVILGPDRGVELWMSGGLSPHIAQSTMLRARYCYRRRAFIDALPGSESILVRIITNRLTFDVKPLCENLNFWAGGDGSLLPFRQYGSHNDIAEKQQLYELNDGESIILVDTKGALVQLYCIRGVPTLRPIDAARLVTLLVERALEQRKASACSWAINNLHAVRRAGIGDESAVRKAIDQLNRQRSLWM